MVSINTVTGKLNINDLGCTLVHEHLLLRSEVVTFQFPHLYDEDVIYKKAVEGANAVKSQGVKTICDPTVVGMGRDVRFLERVANETDMQIVTATGIYSFTDIPYYFQNREIDHMAEAFIHDIEKGIQNTNIKAGFLKCSADAPGLTQDLEKVFRAIARAHKSTGVPIMTHSHPETENGLNQLAIFEEEGVNLKSVMIGHTGDSTDLNYINKILDKGAYIGMDRFGQGPLPAAKRNEVLLQLLKEGLEKRIFLSQDYCCNIDWYTQESIDEIIPGWSIRFLIDEILPQLQKEGVTDQQIHKMMHENVQNWFIGI